MRPRLALLVVALLTSLASAGTVAPATAQPPAISVEPWLEGAFDGPTYVTNAGDARLFVVERAGTVQVIPDAAADPAPQPFLDLTDRVGSGSSEQGLLSIAFPPEGHMGSHVYASYTDLDGNSVISRFAVAEDGLTADPDSERIVLTQEQPYPNHNGGLIAFGPDEMLYVGFGDGGSQGDPDGNAQRLDTWLGKILRIDVDPAGFGEDAGYTAPVDNPFVGDPDAQPEIWMLGMRNPWRFAFDPTGTMIAVADVGQNEIEEVTILPLDEAAGANLGWDVFEGSACYASAGCDPAGMVMPSVEYTHSEGGCSVTGGHFLDERSFIYGDYCSGLVWLATRGDDGTWTASEPVATELSISSFGLGSDGALYLCDLNGSVYRVVVA
jgi:glucose/arabinose dehydrogenase